MVLLDQSRNGKQIIGQTGVQTVTCELKVGQEAPIAIFYSEFSQYNISCLIQRKTLFHTSRTKRIRSLQNQLLLLTLRVMSGRVLLQLDVAGSNPGERM